MFGVKNPFKTPTRPETPADSMTPGEHPSPTVDKKVIGAKLTFDRAKKALETRTAENAAAYERHTKAERGVGEAIDNGKDLAQASREMNDAETALKQTQAAVTVARERVNEAQTALQRAEQLVAQEAKYKALDYMKHEVGPEVDRLLAELEQLLKDKVRPGLAACGQAGFSTIESVFLLDARPEFERFLWQAAQVLRTPGGPSRVFNKYSRWSDVFPDPNSFRN